MRKGVLTRVRAWEFASVGLHPTFLDFPQTTHPQAHVISASLRMISPETFPHRWAYLCGMFKKVSRPHYQGHSPAHEGVSWR